jgi:hypothetical protein
LVLQGKVDINETYRALYQELKAEMKTVDGKLFFHPFQSKADEGDVTSEMINPKGIKFEMKMHLHMEARFFPTSPEGEDQYTLEVHIDKVEL